MAIIDVQNLTKEFSLGQIQGLRTMLTNQMRRFMGKPVEVRQAFKALDDVSFSIEQGEVVGLIGHNGAGKSTLLKLISRITQPSLGTVTVKGRISPLIEVGAGFNPEMTGRENIYLNAAILGMPRKAIDAKLDEIVAFAELEQFIDTPIKRYSSGMKVRLGFSVATSVDSEILIVDEVLAVGDLAYQRKCFDRMESLIKHEGRTVIVVSHNIRQIERLCSRVILLDHGRITCDDDAATVCDRFYRESNEKILAQASSKRLKSGQIKKKQIELTALTLKNDHDESTTDIESGAALNIEVAVASKASVEKVEVIVGVQTTDFFYIGSASTYDSLGWISLEEGDNEFTCVIPSLNILPGAYSIRLMIRDDFGRELFTGEMLRNFTVSPDRSAQGSSLYRAGRGVIPLDASWPSMARAHLHHSLQELE